MVGEGERGGGGFAIFNSRSEIEILVKMISDRATMMSMVKEVVVYCMCTVL